MTESGELTPREVTRAIKALEERVEDHRKQISAVRHTANNLSEKFDAARELRQYIDKQSTEEFMMFRTEVRGDIVEIKNKLEPIHDYVTSQRGVDVYRKWLIATAIALTAVLVTVAIYVWSG